MLAVFDRTSTDGAKDGEKQRGGKTFPVVDESSAPLPPPLCHCQPAGSSPPHARAHTAFARGCATCRANDPAEWRRRADRPDGGSASRRDERSSGTAVPWSRAMLKRTIVDQPMSDRASYLPFFPLVVPCVRRLGEWLRGTAPFDWISIADGAGASSIRRFTSPHADR